MAENESPVQVKISEKEYYDLEDSIFNNNKYSRKRAAYEARAHFYSPLIKSEWLSMVQFFNYVCCNCESEVIGGIPTKDHIIGIKDGGTSNIRNLQPLCRQCNLSKKDNTDYRVVYCIKYNMVLPEKWRLIYGK